MATAVERLATKTAFINAMRAAGCEASGTTRADMTEICRTTGLYKVPPGWIVLDKSRALGDATYTIPEIDDTETYAVADIPEPVRTEPTPSPVQGSPATVPSADAAFTMGMTAGERSTLIPSTFSGYVPWGHFKDVEKIIRSNRFYPIFITGLSGNGKTLMVEQVCAKLKRECYRVNITRQTDEDDLLGGFRLINGNTVWVDGPVVSAMKNGGVLLLDEIDLGSANLMCLQPVLEGKGVFLKKIGQWVTPADGFTVFATANTKGKGSDDGRFVGTGVMNEAMLDRFPVTFEQPYPTPKTEQKILTKAGMEDEDFCNHLTAWSDTVRKGFYAGAVDEIISTRRLVDIANAFAIFGNREKAIAMCLARFDDETRESFMSLYEKIDADLKKGTDEGTDQGSEEPVSEDTKCPF